MKLVELDPNHDFAEISKHIELLFTELFDQDAKLAPDELNKIKHQWLTESPKHQAFKLVEGQNTLAFFTLAESFAFFAHGRYGIINELWVDPKQRGQGTGKALIEQVRKLAENKGWTRVDVTAPASEVWQRTFEFYQKNGFIFTGKKLKILI